MESRKSSSNLHFSNLSTEKKCTLNFRLQSSPGSRIVPRRCQRIPGLAAIVAQETATHTPRFYAPGAL